MAIVLETDPSAMPRHGLSSAAFRADRRWSRRLACDLTVTIQRDGVLTERGRGKNLGLEGMFVALDPTSYSPRGVMEVIFTYPDVDGQQVFHRITSAVSHVDASGIGIQFMRFDPSLFRTVQLMLEQPSRCRISPGPAGYSPSEDPRAMQSIFSMRIWR